MPFLGDKFAATDETLMYKIQQGDEQAFATLVDRHLTPLYNFIYRILNHPTDSEDLVQDTFLRVWDHSQQWKSRENATVSTWLHKIAYHLCIDYLRRRHPIDYLSEEEMEQIPASTQIMDSLQELEVSREVEKALQDLPTRQKTALVLCYYQDLSNQEAATVLGITVSALESLMARGRKTLRQKLQLADLLGEVS